MSVWSSRCTVQRMKAILGIAKRERNRARLNSLFRAEKFWQLIEVLVGAQVGDQHVDEIADFG